MITHKITKKEMKTMLFNLVTFKSLPTECFDICALLSNEAARKDNSTNHKTLKDILDTQSVKLTSSYKFAFSLLKKIGLIIKVNKYYTLNPLVINRVEHYVYEPCIRYYITLFKGTNKELVDSIKEIQLEAIDTFIKQNAGDYYINAETWAKLFNTPFTQDEEIESIYELAFLSNSVKFSDKKTISMKNKVLSIYKNICYNYLDDYLAIQKDILIQQGVLKEDKECYYLFNKIRLKDISSINSYKTYI